MQRGAGRFPIPDLRALLPTRLGIEPSSRRMVMLVSIVSQIILVAVLGAILGTVYGALFPLAWFQIQPFFYPKDPRFISMYIVDDAQIFAWSGLVLGSILGAITGALIGAITIRFFLPLSQPRWFRWSIRLILLSVGLFLAWLGSDWLAGYELHLIKVRYEPPFSLLHIWVVVVPMILITVNVVMSAEYVIRWYCSHAPLVWPLRQETALSREDGLS
jgi:hypothetical protein